MNISRSTNKISVLLIQSSKLIYRSVKTIGVNEAFARREKTLMVTSTPFRIEGVEPMPWGNGSKVYKVLIFFSLHCTYNQREIIFEIHSVQATERPHCTKARPFSFEERNKQIQQRKARKLETILQAEKEARKFRANPVPKFLKKKSTTNSNGSLEKQTSDNQTSQSAPPRFRAKSPKVSV